MPADASAISWGPIWAWVIFHAAAIPAVLAAGGKLLAAITARDWAAIVPALEDLWDAVKPIIGDFPGLNAPSALSADDVLALEADVTAQGFDLGLLKQLLPLLALLKNLDAATIKLLIDVAKLFFGSK